MRQYSFDRCDYVWGGLDLKPGMASGDSFVEADPPPAWINRPTGMGKVVSQYQTARNSACTVLIDPESDVHKLLRRRAQQDRLTRDQVYDLTVRDNSTGEVFTYTNTRITQEPGETRGQEMSPLAWIFSFEDRTKTTPTGNNVVGS